MPVRIRGHLEGVQGVSQPSTDRLHERFLAGPAGEERGQPLLPWESAYRGGLAWSEETIGEAVEPRYWTHALDIHTDLMVQRDADQHPAAVV